MHPSYFTAAHQAGAGLHRWATPSLGGGSWSVWLAQRDSDSAARHEGLVRVRRADALDGVDIVLIDIEHGSNIHGMRYILRTCPHVPLQSV